MAETELRRCRGDFRSGFRDVNGQGLQDACDELGAIACRIHDLKRDSNQAKRRETEAMFDGRGVDGDLKAEQLKAAKIIQALDFGPDFVNVLADLKKR